MEAPDPLALERQLASIKERGGSQQLMDHLRHIHNAMHICYLMEREEARFTEWTVQDLQQASGLPATEVSKCIDYLMELEDIVEVVNNKSLQDGATHYYRNIAFADYETDSCLEAERESCLEAMGRLKVATLETLVKLSQCYRVLPPARGSVLCSTEVIAYLIHRNQVVEVVSNGVGEFESIPAGQVCYKLAQ